MRTLLLYIRENPAWICPVILLSHTDAYCNFLSNFQCSQGGPKYRADRHSLSFYSHILVMSSPSAGSCVQIAGTSIVCDAVVFPSPCDTSIPHCPGLNCLNLTATSPQRFRVTLAVFSASLHTGRSRYRPEKLLLKFKFCRRGRIATNNYPGSLPATLVNITSSRRHDARGDTYLHAIPVQLCRLQNAVLSTFSVQRQSPRIYCSLLESMFVVTGMNVCCSRARQLGRVSGPFSRREYT